MKTYTRIFVALTIVLLCTEYVMMTKYVVVCPEENCIKPEKCEKPIQGDDFTTTCRGDNTCCDVVKQEFRTHCRHHGGECMNECNSALQRKAVDCPSNEVCCVLVN